MVARQQCLNDRDDFFGFGFYLFLFLLLGVNQIKNRATVSCHECFLIDIKVCQMLILVTAL